MLKLLLFVLPLGLDTFALAAALGVQGLPKRERLRVSLWMSSFEMAMPVVGLLLGRGLGSAIGSIGDFIAAAVLIVLGLTMLRGDDDESAKVAALGTTSRVAMVGLGLSISLDELAVGFTIGLLRLPIPLAIVLIGVQAFLFAQIGLRLGARLSEAAREWAERLAGAALIGIGALTLAEALA